MAFFSKSLDIVISKQLYILLIVPFINIIYRN